jgi:hypothetical protein
MGRYDVPLGWVRLQRVAESASPSVGISLNAEP